MVFGRAFLLSNASMNLERLCAISLSVTASYPVSGPRELDKLLERGRITHVFMGENEYRDSADYFEKAAAEGLRIVVLASADFALKPSSKVIILPKPLYGYTVVSILNGHTDLKGTGSDKGGRS